MTRQEELERKSKETEIKATLNVDGRGQASIKTNIGFLDHMLDLFSFHGFFDLNLIVNKDDQEIDIHHTNEDIGIVLGKVFNKALGEEKAGIKRFGTGFAPMESTLARSTVDISGRGFATLSFTGDAEKIKKDEGYSLEYFEHFLESFANGLGATINVEISHTSGDVHTNVEAAFKSLGLALDQATTIDPRRAGAVPSTKGIID